MERQILRVNLSSGSIRQEDIPAKVGRDFVGGRPLAARYLLRRTGQGLGLESDAQPERFLREGIENASIKAGPFVRLPELVQTFYRRCGWDEEGRPTPAALDRLELELVHLDQRREFKVASSKELTG